VRTEKGAGKEAKGPERAVQKSAGKGPKQVPPKPSGHVPEAVVMTRHGRGMMSRPGRGFSLGELLGVGLAPKLAASWGIRVDARRRSVVEGNVGLLRKWSSHSAAPKAEVEQKRDEKKPGEAATAMKEDVKAVRKGAKKGEVAPRVKAEKPKARQKKKS
jgi:ribosomal protein L13E